MDLYTYDPWVVLMLMLKYMEWKQQCNIWNIFRIILVPRAHHCQRSINRLSPVNRTFTQCILSSSLDVDCVPTRCSSLTFSRRIYQRCVGQTTVLKITQHLHKSFNISRASEEVFQIKLMNLGVIVFGVLLHFWDD